MPPEPQSGKRNCRAAPYSGVINWLLVFLFPVLCPRVSSPGKAQKLHPGGVQDGSGWSFRGSRENDHRGTSGADCIPEGMPDPSLGYTRCTHKTPVLGVDVPRNRFAALLRIKWLAQTAAHSMRIKILLPLALLLFAGTSCRQPAVHPAAPSSARRAAQSNMPGKQPDGSMLLPNQWSLRPAGTQIELRDFPINVAVHPNNRFSAVLHSGYSANQASIIYLLSGHALSHASNRL